MTIEGAKQDFGYLILDIDRIIVVGSTCLNACSS